jgi:hypothetical protein
MQKSENFIPAGAGKYTLHEVTSENRKQLGQLAARHNTIIKSTTSNINGYIREHGCAPELTWSIKLIM